MARNGDPNAGTDAGVGALAARSGVIGAFLNVKINASGLKDKELAADIISRAEKMVDEANALEAEVIAIVNQKIG